MKKSESGTRERQEDSTFIPVSPGGSSLHLSSKAVAYLNIKAILPGPRFTSFRGG